MAAISQRRFGAVVNDNLEEAFSKLKVSESPFPFATFSKQQNLLDALKDTTIALSYEVSDNGARRFFHCEPLQLWKKCIADKKFDPKHFYEIIIPNRPCRLYVDLDLKEITEDFKFHELYLSKMLHLTIFHYLLELKLLKNDINCNQFRLIVQTATEKHKKISLHFIWPDLLFQNNRAAGDFIRDMCKKMEKYSTTTNTFDKIGICCCSIQKLDEKCLESTFKLAAQCFYYKDTLILDQGVYDRSRNWRLWKSVKRKGGVPLRLLKLFGFQKQQNQPISEEQIFLDSLVSICPRHLSTLGSPNIIDYYRRHFVESSQISSFSNSQTLSSQNFTSGQAPSPFPEVDEFIVENIIGSSKEEISRYISSWRYFASSNTLMLSFSKRYRFCNRIGRPHRSNGVYFTVSLRSGEIYQRCFDIDCRSFKSFPPWLLPRSLLLIPSTCVEKNLK